MKKIKKYTPKDLSRETLEKIIEKYGDQIEDIFPLAPGQEWMLGRYKQITGPFFLQTVVRIVMPMHPESFEKTIRQACQKRPGMRTAFAWRNIRTPFQVVLKNREPEIRFIDRTDQTLQELSDEIDSFCRDDRARGFDLENDPLFRIVVFLTKEKDTSAIIISRPHLIEDGASQILMLKELFIDYLLKGKIPLPDFSRVSYRHYAQWLDTRDWDAELNYWKGLLKDARKTPVPGRRISAGGSGIRFVQKVFTEEENQTLRVLPVRYKATMSSIIHAAWSVLLSDLTGESDILFGTITSGRPREVAGIDRMTGCFMNGFPVRADVRKEEGFGAFARRLQSQILTSQKHAVFSPDELGRRLKSEEGFFDHLLNFQNYPGIPASVRSGAMLPDFTVLDMESYDNLDTGFSGYFMMQEGRLSWRFVYDETLFSSDTVKSLSDAFARVLKRIGEDFDACLTCGEISAGASATEVDRIMAEEGIVTVCDLMLARQETDTPALIWKSSELTCRQLAEKAKRIAGCLMARGIRKGDRVLLTVQNCLYASSALYGILLAGGVLVAAEPGWPEARLERIRKEANTVLQLTDRRVQSFLEAAPDSCQTGSPFPVLRGEDEAVIFYTSGSTGDPKGTVLTHRVLKTFAAPGEQPRAFQQIKRALTFPLFSTVLTCCMLFATPSEERTLVFASAEEFQSVEKLCECIRKNRIDTIAATPSFLLRCLSDPCFAGLFQKNRFVVSGGEGITRPMAEQLLNAMEAGALFHVYGSSEMYLCSVFQYKTGKKISLGTPLKHVKMVVADEKGNPLSPGEAGELMIGGLPGLDGHYLNSELTRKKYIKHPVLGRLYRTGDAAQTEADGEISFLGRTDHMIKLHGLRIEPGEIEAFMVQFEGIKRAAVSLKKEQLIGYYTAEEDVDEPALRQFLSAQLPHYMIPGTFLRLETLPVTRAGKLDYKALPEPLTDAGAGAIPVTERERVLCRIFQEVLKQDLPICADDNFFSLGGDSIRALMVISLLEKEGFRMELKDLFLAPNAKLLAPLLSEGVESCEAEDTCLPVPEEVKAAVAKAADPEEVEAVYPASAVMEAYLNNNHNPYPQVYCFEIPAAFPTQQIQETLADLGRKHTALRSVVIPTGSGHYSQVVFKEPKIRFFETDLSSRTEGTEPSGDGLLSDKQRAYLSTLIHMEYSSGTELGRKVALRVGRIRISEEQAVLYLGSSHLVMEGSSVYRIFHELMGKAEAGNDAELVKRHFRQLLTGDRSSADAYWERLLKGSCRFTELPQNPYAEEQGKRDCLPASAGAGFTKKVTAFCRKQQVTMSAFLSYTLGKSLMELLSLDEVCFAVTGSGRAAYEMHVPGMYVVSFPLRITGKDTLYSCQEQLLCSFKHAWVFADPAYPNPEGNPVLLNVQNFYTGEAEGDGPMISYTEIFGLRQASRLPERYPVSYGNAIGIIAETNPLLGWGILFDTGRYEPSLIRGLSAEWIRQMKGCIREEE